VVRAQALQEGALGDQGLIDGLNGSAWAVRGFINAWCRGTGAGWNVGRT
jgi:hypothetical protein